MTGRRLILGINDDAGTTPTSTPSPAAALASARRLLAELRAERPSDADDGDAADAKRVAKMLRAAKADPTKREECIRALRMLGEMFAGERLGDAARAALAELEQSAAIAAAMGTAPASASFPRREGVRATFPAMNADEARQFIAAKAKAPARRLTSQQREIRAAMGCEIATVGVIRGHGGARVGVFPALSADEARRHLAKNRNNDPPPSAA